MPTRTARSAWKGTLEQGSGQVDLPSSGFGTFELSFPKRCRRRAGPRSGGPLDAGLVLGLRGGIKGGMMRCTGNGRPPEPPQPRPNGR